MSESDGVRRLKEQLSLEQDPQKRRVITARIVAQVQVGWGELFELFAKERDPQRMLLMLAELDAIIEADKAKLKAGHS